MITISRAPVYERCIKIKPMESLPMLKVLVVIVYAYGNLGDEMETTPLLRQIAAWQPALFDVQVMDKSGSFDGSGIRMFSGVDNVYFSINLINISNYNAIIHAPGPRLSDSAIMHAACNSRVPVFIFAITLAENPDKMTEAAWSFLESSC
ncbi:unnamed protein product, partial [Rotaria magnacalcarata]